MKTNNNDTATKPARATSSQIPVYITKKREKIASLLHSARNLSCFISAAQFCLFILFDLRWILLGSTQRAVHNSRRKRNSIRWSRAIVCECWSCETERVSCIWQVIGLWTHIWSKASPSSLIAWETTIPVDSNVWMFVAFVQLKNGNYSQSKTKWWCEHGARHEAVSTTSVNNQFVNWLAPMISASF